MGPGLIATRHTRLQGEGSQDGPRLVRQLLNAHYDRFEPSLQAGAREVRMLGMKEACRGCTDGGSGEGDGADLQGGAAGIRGGDVRHWLLRWGPAWPPGSMSAAIALRRWSCFRDLKVRWTSGARGCILRLAGGCVGQRLGWLGRYPGFGAARWWWGWRSIGADARAICDRGQSSNSPNATTEDELAVTDLAGGDDDDVDLLGTLAPKVQTLAAGAERPQPLSPEEAWDV